MIEIPEPPTVHACATCPAILSWLWSPKTRAWICVIPLDTTTFRLHECRHAQAPGTWRALAAVPDPGQADINAAGRAAVEAALKTRTGTPGPDTEMWCVCGAPDRPGPCAQCIPDTTDGESE